MPLLGFTRLKDKLLDGSKLQTIRKPRKYPLKVGDKLYVYWKPRTKECHKMGEAEITQIVRKKLRDIDEEDTRKDGFECWGVFFVTFREMHPEAKLSDEFDIITFKWTKR